VLFDILQGFKYNNQLVHWQNINGNYNLVSRLVDGQVEQIERIQVAGMESGYVVLLALTPAAEIRIYR